MPEEKTQRGTLIIKDRKNAVVSGVKNILGFGEEYVELETELGRLVLEGKKMKIDSLVKEDGMINIVGYVSSAYYSEIKPKSGFLSRWFK